MQGARLIRVVALMLTLFACEWSYAQADSCRIQRKAERKEHWQARYVDYNDSGSRFRVAQLVAPVALVGVGSTIMAVPELRERIDVPVRDKVVEATLPKEPLGDYLQYIPAVSAYVLNVAGVKGRHSYIDATVILATSWATMGVFVNGTKYTVQRMRPDGSKRNSFVSGHTATAFMGAEFLRREYRDVSPWIGVAGYTVATAVGASRVLNNRHWVSDVVAGAGVGILSVQVAYWLFPPLQRLIYGVRKDGTPRRSYTDCAVSASPWWDGQCGGASVNLVF